MREQRPLATAPNHSSHLAERVDATIGRMYQDGLLDRPRRGHYLLSTMGRGHARALRKPGVADRAGTVPRSSASVANGRPRDAGRGQPRSVGSLPSWAAGLGVGRWRAYRPKVRA